MNQHAAGDGDAHGRSRSFGGIAVRTQGQAHGTRTAVGNVQRLEQAGLLGLSLGCVARMWGQMDHACRLQPLQFRGPGLRIIEDDEVMLWNALEMALKALELCLRSVVGRGGGVA